MRPDLICGHNGSMESKHTPRPDAENVTHQVVEPVSALPADDEIDAPDIEALTKELADLDPAEAPEVADRIADLLAKQLDGSSD